MEAWLVNGQPGGMIHPADRGFAYGDGLFETIAVRNGRPRLLERHFARMADGCRRLGLPDPPLQVISDEIDCLSVNQQRGTVKLFWSRGTGPRGYRIPERSQPTRIVTFGSDPGSTARYQEAGVRVVSCRTPASCNSALAGLKTLTRLDSVLARSEFGAAHAEEGLMWTESGSAVGGTMSNLFLVEKGRLVTPALGNCGIRGVMRGLVLEAAASMGLSVEESNCGRQRVDEADELFLTNALIGLWPVRSHDQRVFSVGPISRAITLSLRDYGVDESGK